jgi:hypothetical protein
MKIDTKSIFWLIFIVILFAVVGSAFNLITAESDISTPEVNIDWEKGIITATGFGPATTLHVNPTQARALALRKAVIDAQARLIAIIKDLATSTTSQTEKDSEKSKDLENKLKQISQKMSISQLKYLSDNTVKIVASLPLYGKGSVGEFIYPIVLPKSEGEAEIPYEIELTPVSRIGMLRETQDEGSAADREAYTGLIVDATGTELKPAMSPRITTKAGDEIYGTLKVNPNYVTDVGIAAYTYSIEEAQKLTERIGQNPLVVKALNARGPFLSDAVIDESDAQQIKDATLDINFLKKCKVVFVTK